MRRGFTLLEVMVAVAILALALTAIFASEAGSIKVAHRAHHTSVASLLARCKMGELEQQVMEEGLPAVEDRGSDNCCEDAPRKGYSCEWRIERVVLPDETAAGKGEGNKGPLGGALGAAAAAKGSKQGDSAAGGPLSKITGGGGEGDTKSFEGLLGGTGNPQDALTQLAVSFAFPLLKPAIEKQVRRATVTVKWKEGTSDKSFDVVQFMVAPPPEGPGGSGRGPGSGNNPGGNNPGGNNPGGNNPAGPKPGGQ